MTWSGSYAKFGCVGAGNWPGLKHPLGRQHYREMYIDRGRLSSPLAMRCACRELIPIRLFPERHRKRLSDGSAYFYARNAAEIDYYRDLAERWLRKRKFGIGLHKLNLRKPLSVFIQGDLLECLAYAVAWIDENSNHAFRREVSVSDFQLGRLEPTLRAAYFDEHDGEWENAQAAMMAGNLLYVYDATYFSEDVLDVVKGLMRRVSEHSEFCYEEISSLVKKKSVTKRKLPADYC